MVAYSATGLVLSHTYPCINIVVRNFKAEYMVIIEIVSINRHGVENQVL